MLNFAVARESTVVGPRYPAVPEGAKIRDYPKATPSEQEERMAGFRKVVAEHQYQPVHWVDRDGTQRQLTVDATTASMVCQVYDALLPDNRAVFCALTPPGMINLGWKLCK